MPLPLIGNILEIARSGPGRADIYMKWRYQFGPIFTYWLGEQPVICIAEYAKMVETFIKDGETFGGRPDGFDLLENFIKKENGEKLNLKENKLNDLTENSPRGILSSNGEEWREQRRFVMQVLRNLGLGKNQIEENVN